MGKYIYESHCGGLYATERRRSDDDLYCETCHDSDIELGYAENVQEALALMRNISWFSAKSIFKFVRKEFERSTPMRKAIIICGFPGVGKTTAANNSVRILDAESSNFHWLTDPNFPDVQKLNPLFPQNYRAYIEQNLERYDYILASSHKEVREELVAAGLPYIIAAPEVNSKNEYLARYLRRGNDAEFICRMHENWEDYIKDLFMDDAPVIWLRRGETLSDIIGEPYKFIEQGDLHCRRKLSHDAK